MPEFYPSALIASVTPGLISADGGVELIFTGTFPVNTALNGWIGWAGDASDIPLLSTQEGRGSSLISSDGIILTALSPRIPVGDVVITLRIDGEYHHYISAKIVPPLLLTKPVSIRKKFQPFYDLGSRSVIGGGISYASSEIPITQAETPLYVAGSGGQIRKLDTSGWSVIPSLPGGHTITAIKVLGTSDKLLAGSPEPSLYGGLWLLEHGSWAQIWTPPYYQYGIEDFPLISLHEGQVVATRQGNGSMSFALGTPPSMALWSNNQITRNSAAFDGNQIACVTQTNPVKIYSTPIVGGPAWMQDSSVDLSSAIVGQHTPTIDRSTGHFLVFFLTTSYVCKCYEGTIGAWTEVFSEPMGQACFLSNGKPFLIRDNGDVYFTIHRGDQYQSFFRRVNNAWSTLHREFTIVEHNAGWFGGSVYFPMKNQLSSLLTLTGDTFNTVDVALGTPFQLMCCTNGS